MKSLDNIKKWYRDLPDKKRYIEVISATLTVPVLITVIINNINTINSRREQVTDIDTPTQQVTYVPVEVEKEVFITPSASPQDTAPTTIVVEKECVKKVGPVSIIRPSESAVVSGDVTLDISYETGEYCSAVWSYRINQGPWSEYTDKYIVLVGLTGGEKVLELRVRSIASNDEKLLTRTFYVDAPTATPSKEATSSAAF